jgi:hypothetical protein
LGHKKAQTLDTPRSDLATFNTDFSFLGFFADFFLGDDASSTATFSITSADRFSAFDDASFDAICGCDC